MQTDNTEFVMAITSRWEAAWYATISCCQTDGAQNEPSTDHKRLCAPGDGLSRAGMDEPGQPASAPTSSATTIPTTPSDAGKASAPVAPSTVTKPTVDTPRAVSTTDRSAARKRGKTEQAENRDERGEDSIPNKARRAQRTPDEGKGDDDDARPSRKRGLEKIERILGLMHGMRPNFFARWR